MNLNCTTGPATRPCTSVWSQGVYRSRSVSLSLTTLTAPRHNPARLLRSYPPVSQRARSRDANPLSRLTEDGARTTDLRDACRRVDRPRRLCPTSLRWFGPVFESLWFISMSARRQLRAGEQRPKEAQAAPMQRRIQALNQGDLKAEKRRTRAELSNGLAWRARL